MSNRESAHYINDKESRGLPSASSWRDYHFLRMGNLHVSRARRARRLWSRMIANTKDGVMIDGRGSYSIDQQRYNGRSAATPSGKSRTARRRGW